MRKPFFGSGEWNWWQGGGIRPWDIWMLVGHVQLQTLLMCQSIGSVLALGVTLLLILFWKQIPLRFTLTALLCGVLCFACCNSCTWCAGENWVRTTLQHEPLRIAIPGWSPISRLEVARDEIQASIVMRKPFFGSGEWNWWRSGGIRPWDLWMLVAGMYGIVGVLSVALLLLMPVILAVWSPFSRQKFDDFSIVIVLIGPLIITLLDSLMNAAIILPYLLIAGALSSQSAHNKHR